MLHPCLLKEVVYCMKSGKRPVFHFQEVIVMIVGCWWHEVHWPASCFGYVLVTSCSNFSYIYVSYFLIRGLYLYLPVVVAADHPPYFWCDHCPQKIRPSSLTYNPSRNVLFLLNYNNLPGQLRPALRWTLFSVRLLHPFCITHCNCYLHCFVKRGGHPKPHLLTYEASSPIYVSSDQSSFHFMNVWRHVQYRVFWHSLLHLSGFFNTLSFFPAWHHVT